MALMMRVRVNRGIEQKQRDINARQYHSNKASEKKERMKRAFYKYDALNRIAGLISNAAGQSKTGDVHRAFYPRRLIYTTFNISDECRTVYYIRGHNVAGRVYEYGSDTATQHTDAVVAEKPTRTKKQRTTNFIDTTSRDKPTKCTAIDMHAMCSTLAAPYVLHVHELNICGCEHE